jgi:hypothetical protein
VGFAHVSVVVHGEFPPDPLDPLDPVPPLELDENPPPPEEVDEQAVPAAIIPETPARRPSTAASSENAYLMNPLLLKVDGQLVGCLLQ